MNSVLIQMFQSRNRDAFDFNLYSADMIDSQNSDRFNLVIEMLLISTVVKSDSDSRPR